MRKFLLLLLFFFDSLVAHGELIVRLIIYVLLDFWALASARSAGPLVDSRRCLKGSLSGLRWRASGLAVVWR